mgnify:CR=1 FL=1
MSKIYNSLKILSIISLLSGGLHVHEHEYHGHFEADEYEISCIHCDLIKSLIISTDKNTPDFFEEFYQLTQEFFPTYSFTTNLPRGPPIVL